MLGAAGEFDDEVELEVVGELAGAEPPEEESEEVPEEEPLVDVDDDPASDFDFVARESVR